MSIEVKGISKTYGEQKALNNTNFKIKSGEVVGFLGPNGAGKSTMMKILTCYIPPSEGDAEVCGFSVLKDSIEIRKRIGYLPEHNPLYLDMYVKEYLEFVGKIYGIKSTARVNEMINMVGLDLEKNKQIGALSKGYRQRVGLAQALIHDPEVLILDEPTSGLDPNQIVEIRDLIKHIGESKTVMLSTHIMQEVEAICDRAIIIKSGEIVANSSIANLINDTEANIVLYIEFSAPIPKNALKSIDGVIDVKVAGNHFVIAHHKSKDIRKELFELAVQHKVAVLSSQQHEKTLEEAFKALTNK